MNIIMEIKEYFSAIFISGSSYKSFNSFCVLKCIEFGIFFLSIRQILIFLIIKGTLIVQIIGLRKEFVKKIKKILVIRVLFS
jgi:hypothetical protein